LDLGLNFCGLAAVKLSDYWTEKTRTVHHVRPVVEADVKEQTA
jgi:hypothetical protein